ncbi:MAG: 2-oxo acid dehydrogenase subunit E2 [Kofleriaceae bacterium]|nr:2-oxo acid dehydrogenase subunit E2 [Kofleriaceae bacterium]MBP6839566.1 2-oxo acid dehydrogenase subunit E2 [Kofleriaceae bacterium]MBP9202361.1 2-oxo acid dehydrogenase subunit E2 [Kofleriaceae bacterium]
MAFEFRLPDIGEGVVEGEVVAWKVKVGDVVKLDQPIVEVMTDKATVELPSPRAGRISSIHFTDGQICPVGQILVVIDDGGAGTSAAPAAAKAHAPAPVAVAAVTSPAAAAVVPTSSAGKVEFVDLSGTGARSRVLATPATRRLARQLGVDLARIAPTGKHGRVTSDDVRGVGKGATTGPAVSAGASASAGPARGFTPVSIPVGGEEERIPLRGLRKRIAETMTRSTQTAAHFTYVEEIDMTDLVLVRERARARATERGVKLTYLPFIVKAVVSGLKKWPMLNASLDEVTQEIVRKKYYHVGIAAQGPHGLAVSVLRDADKRSIFDVAREIDRLGEAVRTGTATRDELVGSTFTITSLGKLGGVLATPIINFPEVAILGVHKIEEKPAVRAGQIVIRHLMNLSISVDHRLADGWDGAMFLQDVKALLEDPTTMFMEMV